MTVADCVQLACEWEARARKLGNVHPGAAFADTSYDDFVRSAAAIREPLTSGLAVGDAILAAVEATRSATGKNTNLGIVLLLAPLAAARLVGRVRETGRRQAEAHFAQCSRRSQSRMRRRRFAPSASPSPAASATPREKM